MSQKMIVALDVGTREERDAITIFLCAKGWQFWHHYADLWLLAGVPDRVTPRELWAELDRLPPLAGRSVLITTVPDEQMSFFGVAVPKAWSWMNKHWGEADLPAFNQPARDQPARDQPARDQPARDQPARDQPAPARPAAEAAVPA